MRYRHLDDEELEEEVAKVYGDFSSAMEEEGGKTTVFITRSDFRKLLRAIALLDNRVQMPYVEQLYDELVQAQYKAMVRPLPNLHSERSCTAQERHRNRASAGTSSGFPPEDVRVSGC